jgi:hypothetical protein
MKKFLIVAVLATGLSGVAGSVFASENGSELNIPGDKWLTVTQITKKFTAQGYDVRQVKVEKGAYEVYAVAKDGKRLEVLVNPATGEILGDETEED